MCIVIGPVCVFATGGRGGGWRCLWVGRLTTVTTITRNCVHRFSPNWVCRWRYVGTICSWLNFGRLRPREGVYGGAKIFGSVLLRPARSVCVSPSAFLTCDLITLTFDLSTSKWGHGLPSCQLSASYALPFST